MKYNEWRDELKQNLLCVTDNERKRVLDYYAEAYADRREAGFTEREIIEDFGAPYDAAQRILADNKSDTAYEEFTESELTRREKKRENREQRRAMKEAEFSVPPPPPPPPVSSAPVAQKSGGDYTWVFVLLCIILAVPIFCVILAMVIVTVVFCIAPVAVAGAGGAAAVWSFIIMAGDLQYGIFTLGVGIVTLGLGIILCPFFFKLVLLMWKLFNNFFKWLRSLFGGKEVTA